MRKHRISDGDAAALLRGEAPAERPELVPVAESIAEFRSAAFASPPRPSAALLARLDLADASEISLATAPAPHTATTHRSGERTSRSRSLGGVRQALGWLAGLGIAAKIVLGMTVAAAASVTGIGAVAGITELVDAVTPEHSPVEERGDSSLPGTGSGGTPDQPGDAVVSPGEEAVEAPGTEPTPEPAHPPGPPEHAGEPGPPEHAGQNGPPGHAGQNGPPEHAGQNGPPEHANNGGNNGNANNGGNGNADNEGNNGNADKGKNGKGGKGGKPGKG